MPFLCSKGKQYRIEATRLRAQYPNFICGTVLAVISAESCRKALQAESKERRNTFSVCLLFFFCCHFFAGAHHMVMRSALLSSFYGGKHDLLPESVRKIEPDKTVNINIGREPSPPMFVQAACCGAVPRYAASPAYFR